MRRGQNGDGGDEIGGDFTMFVGDGPLLRAIEARGLQAVLDAHNRAHEVPNLFVTDGACMASSACVNLSLTYMALTARAADFAATELKAGRL